MIQLHKSHDGISTLFTEEIPITAQIQKEETLASFLDINKLGGH